MAIRPNLRRDRFRAIDADLLVTPGVMSTGAYNEVQHGRYLRFFQKFLGMKGREPSEVTLAAEIMPQISLFHGVENRYLEAWSLFAFGLTQSAVAAQVANFRLRNPVGSNVIFVLEQLTFSPNAGGQVFTISTGPQTADLTTIQTALLEMDSRGSRRSSGIFSVSTAVSSAVESGSQVQLQGGANTPVFAIQAISDEWPLLPGSAITLTSNQVNTAVTCSFRWRERFLEDSERA